MSNCSCDTAPLVRTTTALNASVVGETLCKYTTSLLSLDSRWQPTSAPAVADVGFPSAPPSDEINLGAETLVMLNMKTPSTPRPTITTLWLRSTSINRDLRLPSCAGI